MDNKAILEHAATYFKRTYPGLTAEAIVCFLVLIDMDRNPTVGDVARGVGMTEPQAYHHLSELTAGVGAGLVTLENLGDGRNYVHLTGIGMEAKKAVQALFGE